MIGDSESIQIGSCLVGIWLLLSIGSTDHARDTEFRDPQVLSSLGDQNQADERQVLTCVFLIVTDRCLEKLWDVAVAHFDAKPICFIKEFSQVFGRIRDTKTTLIHHKNMNQNNFQVDDWYLSATWNDAGMEIGGQTLRGMQNKQISNWTWHVSISNDR